MRKILFKYIFFLILFFSSPLLLNCGGGGGGGGGSSGGGGGDGTRYDYSQTASDHKTTEYNNQYGLGKIKAAEGYASLGGYTQGGPVKVAVIDTGIDSDHASLDGQIASGGYDYVNSDSNPEDEYQETINKASAIMAAAEDSYKYN